MCEQVDGGDILWQCPVNIADHETALTLNAKCYEAAIRSFAELIDGLLCGRVSARKRNLGERTFFPRYKRPPVGCVLSWNRCAHDIDAFIRALDFGPYPNPLGLPKLAVGGDFIIVGKTEVLDSRSETPPGTVTNIDHGSIQISTASWEIVLRQLLTIEGQPLSISDAVARFGLHAGYRFRDMDPEQAHRITELNASICKHEKFWVKRLAALRPVALPYAARNGSPVKPAKFASVSLLIPEEGTVFLEGRQAFGSGGA
jgi:polyketide synthase PksN